MEFDKHKEINIETPDVHMEKYNRAQNEMETANRKMVEISRKREQDENNVSVDYKGDKIVTTKLSKEEYSKIWNSFNETEKDDFRAKMGYGKRTIKRIGRKQFIDFMGFRNEADVTRWRTDTVHVIPCTHCNSAFTTFELDYGLCPNCKQAYDMNRFFETCSANEKVDPGSASALRVMFAYDGSFRRKYLKKSIEVRIKECVKDNFEGIDSLRLLRELVSNFEKPEDIKRFVTSVATNISIEALRKLNDVLSKLEKLKSLEDKESALNEIYLKDEVV